ncbi:hypothetical protein [Ruminococcus bicirculans (ex Wegman et al. 2014)]|uniref:hypothetical protein n=1 Tax=Ruminococcus bicirculans (ex Wegman et al. 2014) TaxID=1160721 RepID=UPI0037098DFC
MVDDIQTIAGKERMFVFIFSAIILTTLSESCKSSISAFFFTIAILVSKSGGVTST